MTTRWRSSRTPGRHGVATDQRGDGPAGGRSVISCTLICPPAPASPHSSRPSSPSRRPARCSPALPAPPPLPPQACLTLAAPSALSPRAARRYGVPFTLRLPPAGRRVVAVASPGDLKDVFAGSPSVFHAGKGNDLLRPILGRHSLLLQDGDEHARARRLLAPAFGRREISGYRALVEEVTTQQLGRWPGSGQIRSHVLLNELTLEVILRVV